MATSFITMDLDFIKEFIGISDSDETFDETITSIYPFYSVYIQKLIAVDTTSFTQEDLDFIKGAIAAGVGCHLTVSDRRFGMKTSGYKVGNVTSNFVRRYKTDYPSWCDFFEDLISDIMDFYGDAVDDSVLRPGVYDGYGDPY